MIAIAMRVSGKRVRKLKSGIPGRGPVVLWMSRDQRADDNWALLYAQDLALAEKVPLAVMFCLVPNFLGATLRQYDFMLRGLAEVEVRLAAKNIPFFLLAGEPRKLVPEFVEKHGASVLVTDFNPLKVKRRWEADVSRKISIPFYQVDAHNVVPCWAASEKLEYAARTIRPKIRKVLGEFLEDFPALMKHPHRWDGRPGKVDWGKANRSLRVDSGVKPVSWIRPGEKAAKRALRKFIGAGLDRYAELRNDPSKSGQSNISPYLHFGQLSAQRCALEVSLSHTKRASKEAFTEELIVRRELSDNFCYYSENYDSFDGFPGWARESLRKHAKDRRKYLYEREDFEKAHTHDDLWNAAQEEMLLTGKMHGYMRMYWAKKILEWSASPEDAFATAIYLNDRYELDGRDPNGYAGIAWSIGGVHDRAWPPRPVFGKVRYMSYAGCRSKFDVSAYMDRVKALRKGRGL